MATQARRINRQKIALIHVAAQQLGIGEEDYRALLQGAAGVGSARDLSAAGFDAVMRRFAALGFTSHQAQYGRRAGMATPEQVGTIRALWQVLTAGKASHGAKALRAWLERSFHVSDLRFCDVATAQKAIEGLKAMNARKRASDQASTSTQGGNHE